MINAYCKITFLKEFLRKPEGFFVCTALLFGFLFLIIIPPFQTPDEYTHFYRSYEVSEFKIPSVRMGGELGSYLPSSISNTQEAVRGQYGQIRSNVSGKYDVGYTKHSLFYIPLNKSERSFYPTSSSSPVYISLAYLPQALTIIIAKIFNSPIILMIYLVRLVNLGVWIGLIYCAIKLLPWKKWNMTFIALLPMSVAQSISPGVDVLALGSSFVFISLIISVLNSRRLGLVNTYGLLLTGTVMTLAKPISATLLPLIIVIPNIYFGRAWSVINKGLIITVPVLIYLTITAYLDMLSVEDSSNVISAASIQIATLVSQPWVFLMKLMSTFFFPWGDSITQSLIGNFGWLDTPIASPFIILGYTILFMLIFVNYNDRVKPRINSFQKNIIVLTTIAYFCLTCLAMYIYSSNPVSNFISGIQGRYFIPALILLVIIFSNSKTLLAEKAVYIKVVSIAIVFLLAVSLVSIFFRYYIDFYY